VETATILASEGEADLTPLKEYQLKMLTNKKNAMDQLIEVTNYMLKEDLCMEIMAYDLWNVDSSQTGLDVMACDLENAYLNSPCVKRSGLKVDLNVDLTRVKCVLLFVLCTA
jgi:hypothetical protein